MASTVTPIAPSSPASFSSSISSWKYEVFLSFCGKDTRNNFTDHLRKDLERNGIIVFRDDKEMERGEDIGEELFKAIEESHYAIVIISKDYGSSKWCLKELIKIMERKKEGRMKVFPVFYNVDPSKVRNPMTSSQPEFNKLRKSKLDEGQLKLAVTALQELADCHMASSDERASAGSGDVPEVESKPDEMGRSTLTEAGYLAGWHVDNNRSESIVIEEISKKILEGLMHNLSDVPEFLVGMESQVMEMWRLLDIGSAGVRFVGICGMGGIGKSTLAKVIYERVSSQFTARCFVARIGEASGSEVLQFQKYLLSNIFTEKVAGMLSDRDDVSKGSRVLRERFKHKRVFIVLDDVCREEQIKALAGSPRDPTWFGEGSRIIITSRNRHLPHLEEKNTYNVKELNSADARKLFYYNVFNKPQPEKEFADKESAKRKEPANEEFAERLPERMSVKEFEELVENIVDCGYGHPSAIQFSGSYLEKVVNGNKWKNYLEKLKASLNNDVLKNLRITFDSLDDEVQQQAFLDIACFFNGWYENHIISKLKSLGYLSDCILLELERICLIKFSKNRQVIVHDLLVQMGKKIAGRSRLWRTDDIISALRKKTGINEVKGIALKLHSTEKKKLCYDAFSKMENLRMLHINLSDHDENCGSRGWFVDNEDGLIEWHGNSQDFKLSNELCVMEWSGYPLSSLPVGPNFELIDLVELSLRYSHIERLWDGDMDFSKLKHIDLSFSNKLIGVPDLRGVSNLETLDLSFCAHLRTLNSTIGDLKMLRKLLLQGCCKLKKLPERLSSNSLEVLDLSTCSKLRSFPDISCSSTCLRNLNISGTAIEELHFQDVSFLSLEKFHAFGTKIRKLPSHIVSSEKLKDLCIVCYTNTSFQLPTLSALCSLEVLKLCCSITDEAKALDLSGLSSLKDLDLSYNMFKKIPASICQVTNLRQLSLSGCINLQKLSDSLFSNLRSLSELRLSDCNLLNGGIPDSIGCWSSISNLDLSCNKFTKLPDNMSELSNLDKLNLHDCTSLLKLPKLPLRLRSLHLRNCPSLEAFDCQMTTQISRDMSRTGVCSSTVAYVGFDGKSHKILYLHPESPPYKDGKDHLIEPAVACGPVLGQEISSWFDKRGTGSDERVQICVDWNPEDGLSGPLACALLIVYEVKDKEESRNPESDEHRSLDIGVCKGSNQFFPELVCQLQLSEVGSKQTFVLSVPEYRIGLHRIWVFINLPDSLLGLEPMERCRYLASITSSSKNVELKECTACLLDKCTRSEFSQVVKRSSQSDLDYQSLDHSLNRFLFVTGPIKQNSM